MNLWFCVFFFFTFCISSAEHFLDSCLYRVGACAYVRAHSLARSLARPSSGWLAHHISSSSIPTSRGEKRVRRRAARPTAGSAFCGALDEGMGDVLQSDTTHNTHTEQQSGGGAWSWQEGKEEGGNEGRKEGGRKRKEGRFSGRRSPNQFQSASEINAVEFVVKEKNKMKNLIPAPKRRGKKKRKVFSFKDARDVRSTAPGEKKEANSRLHQQVSCLLPILDLFFCSFLFSSWKK